ncbi:MAG TPA: hypothetical protein VNB89_01375 [Gemmatimonadaceae bacterium]|nr:hypothetical protein [Gemmatimonadaceae bacterium]
MPRLAETQTATLHQPHRQHDARRQLAEQSVPLDAGRRRKLVTHQRRDLHLRRPGRVRLDLGEVEHLPQRREVMPDGLRRQRLVRGDPAWMSEGRSVVGSRFASSPSLSRAFPYNAIALRPTSMRLSMNLSNHADSVTVCGLSTIARSRSAGLRPAASSPAIRSRLARASLIVLKLPPWTSG